jgi:hypothetical protein
VGKRYPPYRYPGNLNDVLNRGKYFNFNNYIVLCNSNVCKTDSTKFIESGQPIYFGESNPGFDIAIFTRTETKKPFLTFIETRYSEEDSKTMDSATTINHKYNLIVSKYGATLEKMGIEWVLVYAAFRNLTKYCQSNAIPERVLVLDVDALVRAYGPSYATRAIFGNV